MSDELKIPAKVLLNFLTELYSKSGLSRTDAHICAHCTVQTNLWGVDSHGILRTPAYIERILKAAVNADPDISFINEGEGKALALMDGDAGMGYVVGRKAMQIAIERAKMYGIAMVVVRNSNHFGMASLYSRQASDAGMLGIVSTNVTPNIGMPGSKRAVSGNNPIALSAPIGRSFPFSLDISMSAVAGGKILLAQKKGEKIPRTWVIDKDGNPTDDPFAGFEGILLPTGMHKGLGLSLFIDILTGAPSGGPFLQDIKGMYRHKEEPSETFHTFMVIDPGFFMERDVFYSRMKKWAAMIEAVPMAGENHQIIPGEIEYRCELQRRVEGLPVELELLEDLNALSGRLGLETGLEKASKR